MEGSKNSVGSGSTAPFTSLIWPGMMKTKTTLRVNVRSSKERQRFQNNPEIANKGILFNQILRITKYGNCPGWTTKEREIFWTVF